MLRRKYINLFQAALRKDGTIRPHQPRRAQTCSRVPPNRTRYSDMLRRMLLDVKENDRIANEFGGPRRESWNSAPRKLCGTESEPQTRYSERCYPRQKCRARS